MYQTAILDPLAARQEAGSDVAALIGAFTYALDLTEGQPAGHALRCCYIAARMADLLDLPPEQRSDVHYAALLKDLGCSSNAARLQALYGADDRAFKQDYKVIAPGLPSTLRFIMRNTARGRAIHRRVQAIANILKNGDGIAQDLILTRCTQGADIAADLGFGPGVCDGIYHLDEHWDGSGRPAGLAGPAIPLAARIALLAQVADVFMQHAGPEAARVEVWRRSGTWLDPQLVATFLHLSDQPGFAAAIASPDLEARVAAMAPPQHRVVDEAFLDSVTSAFGKVIDAKSPFTAGHSGRVADFSLQMGERFGMLPARVRQLRRAAALHDIGKLGVSSAVLEKPGKLDDAEWDVMRGHASQTLEILSRIAPFTDLAGIAAAHHERLDGTGYPLRLDDRVIGRETRIITVCDFYDALTADRPYRAAMPQDQALAIIEGEVGKAVDGDCFAALKAMVA
jgi:HD-GYP domain-containing protein (c-di-GMP phosphodiesterase class II)